MEYNNSLMVGTNTSINNAGMSFHRPAFTYTQLLYLSPFFTIIVQ